MMASRETVDYSANGIALSGQLLHPAGKPRAAVVLFPTIMNQKPNVERRLPMLADAGYLVMMADFYGEDPQSREDAHRLGTALRQDVVRYRAVVAAGVEALGTHPAAQGLSMAALGYCMGGQAVLEAARMNLSLAVVASFHGILSTDAPATEPIHPRILVCHGDRDPLVPRDQVSTFQQEMDAVGADWHLHVYSGVKHGFTDLEADSHNLDALGYNASADRQSWAAMLSLFDEVFGEGAT
jgi:dienelactone hydrolase